MSYVTRIELPAHPDDPGLDAVHGTHRRHPRPAAPFGPRDRDRRRLRHVINANRAFATLREHGHTTTTIDAGIAHAQVRRVDRYIEQPQPMELENLLLGETRLHDLIEAVAPERRPSWRATRTTGEFAAVTALAAEPHEGPRLVYADIPTPHPPWVFEADGGPGTLNACRSPGRRAVDAGRARPWVRPGHAHRLDDRGRHRHDPGDVEGTVGHRRLFRPWTGRTVQHRRPVQLRHPERREQLPRRAQPGHRELLADRPSLLTLFNRLFTAYLGAVPRRLRTPSGRGGSYVDVVEEGPFEGWPQSTPTVDAADALVRPGRGALPRPAGRHPRRRAHQRLGRQPVLCRAAVDRSRSCALLLSGLGRLLLGDRDRGGIFAALWVLALLGSEDVRLGLVIGRGDGAPARGAVRSARGRSGRSAGRGSATSSPGWSWSSGSRS